MRARRLAVLASGVLAVLALPGCVSLKRTPEARFFVLHSVAEPPAAPGAGPAVLVGLLPVDLPGYLDRPQIATWVATGELHIDEYVRWAEPLDEGLGRTLAANLEVLLPQGRVLRSPWPSTARLRCRVRVGLQRFGPQPSGEVLLQGRFALLPPRDERPLASRPVAYRRGPLASVGQAPDPGAGVDAMSELAAALARDIAAAIGDLPAEAGESR